jgi:SET domain-containing protein
MEITSPKKVKVTEIQGKGRGVVALQDIEKDEVIEYCPVILLSNKEASFFTKERTPLHFYYLEQPEMKRFCLMLGYGSLYNHSKNPNAWIDYDTDEIKDYLIFKAMDKIKAGEEIVYDYQFDSDKEDFLDSA